MSKESAMNTPIHPVRALAHRLHKVRNSISFFANKLQDALNWQRLHGGDFLRRMEDELPDPLRQEWHGHRKRLANRQKSLADRVGAALSAAEGISGYLSWGMKEDAGKYEGDLRRNLRELHERVCTIGISGRIPWKDFDLTFHDYDRCIVPYAHILREASVTLCTVALPPRTLQPPHRKSSPPELDSGGKRIRIGDKWHDLTEQQTSMLKPLFKAKGQWVNGKHIPMCTRPDKTLARMPNPVWQIIESNRQRGYRILSLRP
jgi:hypothetical protein